MLILAVCGNGVGSSAMVKAKIKKFLTEHNIEATVDSGSLGDTGQNLHNADLIFCQQHLADQVKAKVKDASKVHPIKNLLSEAEFGSIILDYNNQK